MVWHHKRRMPGGYATKRTTFELLRGSEGVSGVDQLPALLEIPGNGNSVLPTFRYRLGDADATNLTPWGYGETLAAQGSGGVFNDGSPFVGASDDSFNPNGTRYLRASGSTLANVTTEDMVVELVVKGGATGRAIMSKFSAGNAGWLCYLNSGSTYRAFITDGANTAESASVGFMLPGQWYHFLSFCDRSGSGVTYQNGLVGTPASMTAVGSLTNSLSTTLGAYDNGTVISTGNIAYAAVWLGDGLLDSHLQPDLVQERFQRLCGLWPQRARGTKAWTVFTRATTAVTDKVEYGAELLPSTDPTSGWAAIDASVAADSTVAHPDGASVYSLTENDAAGAAHYTFESTSITAGTEYELSVDFKAAGRDWIALAVSQTPVDSAYYDGSTGTLGSRNNGVAHTVEGLGSGWYRARLRFLANATATRSMILYIAEADKDVLFNGLDQLSLYIANPTLRTWESRLYTVGSGMPRMVHRQEATSGADFKGYLPETAATNLITYSHEFDNAAWAKTRCTVTANSVVAPDGETTADTLVEDGTAASTHYIYHGNISFAAGTSYVISVYAKAANRDWLRIYVATAFPSNTSFFDLSTGTAGTTTADSSGIKSAGNGWFLCWAKVTANSSTLGSCVVAAAEADNDATFDGLSQDSIYVWGAQVEADVDYPTSYIATSGATATRNADVLYLKGDDGNVVNNQRGTMEVETLLQDVDNTVASNIVNVNDGGSTSNRITIYSIATDGAQLRCRASGGNPGDTTTTTDIVDGDAHTLRGVWKTNLLTAYADGTAEGTPDTSVDIPDDLDRIQLGSFTTGSGQLNAPIRNVRIWPKPTTKR